ncbi:type II secretion system protein [Planctomycetota bacterium]
MKSKGFTLIELLVVIAVIAVLMSILMPALNRAREQGKRAMCLGNLKSLQLGWLMYADENEGKIVSGDAGFDERAWVGKTWVSGWQNGEKMAEKNQILEIQKGSLYKYMGNNYKAYRCPTGERGDYISYAITDTMNGHSRGSNIPTSANGVKILIKKVDEIKQPSTRMVFIDEGRVPYDSYALRWNPLRWWDAPQSRHGIGTNLSFADGHVEYWKWTDDRTVEAGQQHVENKWPIGGDSTGKYSDNNDDIIRVGRAFFGTLPN